MTSFEQFKEEFTHDLELAAEAVEDNGYNVIAYDASLIEWDDPHYVHSRESPEEALNNLFEAVQQDDRTVPALHTDDLMAGLQGQKTMIETLAPLIHGGIEVEEPKVQHNNGETVSDPHLAFGINIDYQWTPEGGHVETDVMEVMPPYDLEDAEEHIYTITNALNNYGLEAEPGEIHAQGGPGWERVD